MGLQTRRRRSLRSLVMLAVAAFITSAPTLAMGAAHTCGSTAYCSGNDSTTATNVEGSTSPKIYIGEVGVYYTDQGGAAGPCPGLPNNNCWNGTAASKADGLYANNTGMGAEFYYLGGGASSSYAPTYGSPYCWGWRQGSLAVADAATYFSAYTKNSWVMFLDIEQNGALGWSNANQAGNKRVVQGFQDYVSGSASADSTYCPSGGIGRVAYQPGVYSAPAQWSYSFGSGYTIPNLLEWTYENSGYTTDPGSFTHAAWFGGSSYDFAWQFHQNNDYDLAISTLGLPALVGFHPWN